MTQCSDFYERIQPVFNEVLPEDLKITSIQYWLWALSPCTQRFLHFLWFFSWSFSTICRCRFFKVGEPRSIFTSKMLISYSMNAPVNLIMCYSECFFLVLLTFVDPVPTCLKHFFCFSWNTQVLMLNIWHVFCVRIKMWIYEICRS